MGLQYQLLRLLPGHVWGWFLHLGCVFIPVLFFHVAVFYSKNSYEKILALKISYIVATIFIFLNTFTPFFTRGISYRDLYAYPTPAILYPLYFIFFVSLICWGTFLMFKRMKELSSDVRKWMKLFLLFNILAYIGGMDNFLIMADIRIFPLYPFGLYLVFPYAIIGSYAIVKVSPRTRMR